MTTDMVPSMNDQPTKSPRRRWLSFSLRSMLMFVAVAGISMGWMAWHVNRVRNQRLVVAELSSVGGLVIYSYQWQQRTRQEPPGPKWLRSLLGDDIFADVKEVDIRHDHVTEQTLARVATLPAVLTLMMRSDRISDSGLAHLAKMSTLQQVDLYSPGLSDASLAQLAKIEGLKYLTVDSPQLTDVGLEYVGKLKKLEAIDIKADQVTGESLAQIATLPNLRQLTLDSKQLADVGLVHLQLAPRLKHIAFKKGKLTEGEIERLCEAHPLCRVWAPQIEHGRMNEYRIIEYGRRDRTLILNSPLAPSRTSNPGRL